MEGFDHGEVVRIYFFEVEDIALKLTNFDLLFFEDVLVSLVFGGELFDFGEEFKLIPLERCVLEGDGLIFLHPFGFEGDNMVPIGVDRVFVFVVEVLPHARESLLEMFIKFTIVHSLYNILSFYNFKSICITMWFLNYCAPFYFRDD